MCRDILGCLIRVETLFYLIYQETIQLAHLSESLSERFIGLMEKERKERVFAEKILEDNGVK